MLFAAQNTVISPKAIVFAQFRAIYRKLWGNYDCLQNFHTRRLGEITDFYAVVVFLKKIFFIPLRRITMLLHIYKGCFSSNCQRLQVVHFFAFFLLMFFAEMVNDYQPVIGFTNISIIDVQQGLQYTFVAYQFHTGFTVLTITA